MASNVAQLDHLLQRINRISGGTYFGASDRKRALLEIKSQIERLLNEERDQNGS